MRKLTTPLQKEKKRKKVLPIFVNFLSRHVVKLFGALFGSLISVAKVARIELENWSLVEKKKILWPS